MKIVTQIAGVVWCMIVATCVMAQAHIICCEITYSSPTAGPGSVLCGPGTTIVCESGTQNTKNGYYYRSGTQSLVCWYYALGPGDSYTGDCSTPPVPGYQSLGAMSSGKCCFVKNSVNTYPLPQAGSRQKCDGECKDHTP